MIYEKVWETQNLRLLEAEQCLLSNSMYLKKYIGCGYKNTVYIYKKGSVEAYYSKEDMDNETEHGKLFFDFEKSKNLITICKERSKLIFEFFSRFYEENISEVDNKSLYEMFEEVSENFKEVYAMFHTTQPQTFLLVENELRKIKHFDVLSQPTEPSILKRAKIDWNKTLKNGDVKSYYNKYKFLGSEEGIPPKKIQYYELKFKEKKYENIKDESQELKKTQEKLSKNLDSNHQFFFEIAKVLANLRLDIRVSWVAGEWCYRKLLFEVSKRYNILFQDLENYTQEELKELLLNNKKTDVKKRNEMVVFLQNSKFGFLTGKDSKLFQNKMELERMEELKGQIACKGKLTGKVRMMHHDKDLVKQMKEMKKGEILVASQTRPALMPAIKKAAGIIVDEGGMLSHAAIISRELKKPCIIGTKNATKVLKDGDYIEVDADKGVVKKIK